MSPEYRCGKKNDSLLNKTSVRKLLFSFPVVIVARLVIAYIFIYASIDKIINPAAFSDIIDNYNFTPVMFSNLIALFIPMLELVLGICMLTGWKLEGASLMSLLLMGFFIVLLSRTLILGIDTHCGCFSTVPTEIYLDERAALFKRLYEDICFFVILGYIQLKLYLDKKDPR